MKKRLGLLLTVAMVATSIVGCGGSASNTAETTETAEATVSESTVEEVETAEAVESGEEVSAKLQELREKGKLVVGSSGDVYAYIDEETGEFDGIDAVIIKEVAKRLGIAEVEMSLMPFSELILNLNSGNIDIIADGMYIKADRAKQIYYGDVWYTQGGSLVVNEDSPIQSMDDFDPATTTVGFTTGTAWQAIVEGWAEDGLIKAAVATGDQTESLIALQYKKIDAFLTDSTCVEDLFGNSPETVEGLRLCAFEDDENTLGHIAPSVAFGDEDFMAEINEVVAQLRDEGFLEQAFKDCGLDPELHMITNDERVFVPAE